MHPVKATGWLNTDLSYNERGVLIKSGIVPVNDAFFPIWDNQFPIWLLFGGRGGGKSEAVFDRLINNALTDPYFRCYYGRKVFDTVRGSCFKTIVESINKLGLANEFVFSEADNSTMIITCKRTRNQFIPFGSDKPDKLKSIKDPTHVVCEEFNQFTFLDFQELFPTLRTPRAFCEFFGMFNTKDVYEGHWITRVFFPERYKGNEKVELDFMKEVQIKKIFANLVDNYFLDPDLKQWKRGQQEYLNRLKVAAGGNLRLFDAIANGAWGVTENEAPWLYSFDYDKHVRKVPFLPDYPVYLSFDFNNDPFACVAEQMSDVKGAPHSFCHTLQEFVGEMKVEIMCDKIKTAFPNSIFFITGDRSGQNEDIGRNQTIYQIIASKLGCSERQLRLNTSNLTHADSRLLCNSLLHNYPNMFIDPSCTNLIADCQKATIDLKSTTPSALLKDRANYKMDAFDAWRYNKQTYFNKFAKETYFKLHK